MPGILHHLGRLKHISGHVNILQTARQCLEGLDADNLDYDDKEPRRSKGEIIEPHLTKKASENGIEISLEKVREAPKPIFTYFLDGSRRTYKVAELSWNKGFFPLIAGQIVVACCHRQNSRTFRKEKSVRKALLSVPVVLDADNQGNNFYRYTVENLNKELRVDKRLEHLKGKMSVGIDNIVSYKVDGRKEGPDRRNDFVNRAIASIQGTMTDIEQDVVTELCNEGKLNYNNWLIKDGSLEYNPSYSYGKEYRFNIPKDVSSQENLRIRRHRSCFEHVMGASKLFDPDLICDIDGKPMSQALARLLPYHRTYAYKYYSMHSQADFVVWYVRLRDSRKSLIRNNLFSDILKCELLYNSNINRELIDELSLHLIREAHPTCYGVDSRWGNHLYPIYLTESYCKSCYMSNEAFLNLF